VNFGFYSLLFLLLQILTGVLLAMFYNPDPMLAFSSIIELTMRFIMDDFCVQCMLMELPFFLLLFIFIWLEVILWFIFISKTFFMDVWSNNLIINGRYGFFRLCFALGPDEFLRSYGYHKSFSFYSIDW
jgi:hypothetical protein